jgi:1-hydroxy-2-naphthoate dioxygenase
MTLAASLSEQEIGRFYDALGRAHLRGEWQLETTLENGQAGAKAENGAFVPRAGGQAHLWPWRTMRELLDRSCDIVPESFTARRALGLYNPGLPRGATQTIAAGVQIIRPGELAWAHRHSITALRFIIEGSAAATTVVRGESHKMEDFDLVLTPAWEWHDHENAAARPIIWLDVLDVPLIMSLNQMFFEPFGEARQPQHNDPGSSATRLAPPATVLYDAPNGAARRMRYPWREIEPLLLAQQAAETSPYDGTVLEYVDPTTGSSVLPALGCWLQLLRPGQSTRPHRHSSSSVYFVVRGSGSTEIEGTTIEWNAKDLFVVPNWSWHRHENRSLDDDAVLFSVNDIPLLRFLGLYREEPEISLRHAGRSGSPPARRA